MKFEHPAIPFAGRLLIAYIFLTSGLSKAFDWSGNLQYMQTRPLPAVTVLLFLATVIELGGTIALVTGYKLRPVAMLMAVYLLIVTVTFHNYWDAAPGLAGMRETEFRKNLAIIGGLLFVAWAGPGRWALGGRDIPALSAKPGT